MSKLFYNLSLRLAADFPKSRRLRIHVNLKEDENFLIYPYYQHTPIGLLQEDSKISDVARKKILRQTAVRLKHYGRGGQRTDAGCASTTRQL